nr:immunoglobulin heavy chain junction region [Mus musculus]MBK4183689.1 immunoglobulin heavy chain junction region [Mus musculus]MBK4183690.1 immunoglobulin heavy chain junction region [Mus musculus]MBK4183691.1 immunoglobulin heavy chain junction region [Mus musculus]
CARSNWDGAYW